MKALLVTSQITNVSNAILIAAAVSGLVQDPQVVRPTALRQIPNRSSKSLINVREQLYSSL